MAAMMPGGMVLGPNATLFRLALTRLKPVPSESQTPALPAASSVAAADADDRVSDRDFFQALPEVVLWRIFSFQLPSTRPSALMENKDRSLALPVSAQACFDLLSSGPLLIDGVCPPRQCAPRVCAMSLARSSPPTLPLLVSSVPLFQVTLPGPNILVA